MQHAQPKLLERSAASIAVQSAVREIQSRAAGASAGQLSVAEAVDDTGALSFPAETGTLTITPDDPGEQAPPPLPIQEPTLQEPD
jgi:hypothetical protein